MLEEYLGQKFSNATRKTYKSILGRFLKYLDDKGLMIGNITPELVLEYSKGYKDITQNKIISSVRTYYHWVTKLDLQVDSIKCNTFRPDRDLSISEVRKLIKFAPSRRESLLIKLLFTTGIRVNEIANITKQDIQKENGHYFLYFIAKGNKERKIKLQSVLARELLEFNSNKDTLFGISKRQVERIISNLSQQVLSRNVTPHCFRHGFATELMKQGVSFGKIKDALGHNNIETTLRYIHNNAYGDTWFIEL